ncbi:cytochrome c biogenesis protein [Pseudonocardia sulfidoxydans NBRC 16205]|uniref:Cytochrome c biogenesis protein n=1 Tax=Pseudonocardia sulfidoxydans NBRC 16205 TaxID=1223511 RepID=A0A511DBF8_9PSEU|nr:cytochrome c biogenesis protein ResB [Pseudonocardia sulfidoxydans]GEL22142.1 cytochrome c biogenesis protein [Pseudonocardia sulfidoxydans NBRC 16205]
MSSPPTAPPEAAAPESEGRPPRQSAARRVLAFLRNTWRGLTSMRTALILLFLLALAALPGALLPQRSLNQQLVDQYFTDYPTLAPILDKGGFFDVFATPWFAAIYLLLMISLIGCLVPRNLDFARAMRSDPVATPRNLARLPHHATATLDEAPDAVLARVRTLLGGNRFRAWQRAERDEPGGARTVSAEKGRLREAGNLVFHLSLVGLLVGLALGKLFGYEGQVIVLSGGSQFCNSSILGYDSFRAGLRVDGTELAPFCVRVDDFAADYLPNGQPDSYRAQIGYQTAEDVEAGDTTRWSSYDLRVNHPLRVDGARVYLLGHGYAPRFTVTWPDGQQRTGQIQWRPVDMTTMLSEGATKFERPGVTDPAQRQNSQLAVTGLFAPTSSGGQIITSVYPDLRNPQVAVDVLRGDLGLDDGRGQSIFSVDQAQVDSGALTRVARANLLPGESLTLDDGTQVRFDDVTPWVSLQVSHDPGQETVLIFAILLLAGLGVSLAVKRRRFWVRVVPAGDGRTEVRLGGLARTDQAGYGEEFDRLRAAVLGAANESHPPPEPSDPIHRPESSGTPETGEPTGPTDRGDT